MESLAFLRLVGEVSGCSVIGRWSPVLSCDWPDKSCAVLLLAGQLCVLLL
jgi:hypothetical protein